MFITTRGRNLALECSTVSAMLLDKLRTMPGRRKWAGRTLMIEPSGVNVQFLKRQFPTVQWDSGAEDLIAGLKKTETVNQEGQLRKQQPLPVTVDAFPFRTEPFEHQKRAFYLSRDKQVYALLMEMGTGKSKVILDTAAYLYSVGEIDTLLVVAPNGIHQNWCMREAPTHFPTWVPWVGAYYSAAATKSEKDDWTWATRQKDRFKLLAVNIETLSHRSGRELVQGILLGSRALLVVDESSKIKTPSAERTKNLVKKIGPLAKYRRILSGTPITQGLEDLYSQFSFLDPGILGCESFYTFRNQFCTLGGFENRQIVGYQNTDELFHKISGHTFRVLKKDCLDLPDKLYVTRPVYLSDEQDRIYKELKRDFMTEFEGELMTEALALTRYLRLQQVISGHWAVGDTLKPIDKVNPRIEALREILEGVQGKTIIWSRFTADIELICQSLPPGSWVRYDGQVPDEIRKHVPDRFQNDPRIRFFVANQQAGGTGLTLTAANTVVYYANSFSLEQRLQSEDRCHRIGTKNAVTYYDLEAQNTLDTKIIGALLRKQDIASLLKSDVSALLRN